MEPLRIAALQLDLIWHDPEANRRKITRMLKEFQVSADIILLPEMFTTGFTMKPNEVWEEPEGPTVDWMMNLAHEMKALIGGSMVIREDMEYFNRFILADEHDIQVEYNKRHLFRMAGEHEIYEPGSEWVWFEYRGWKIAPLICYDLRFPVWSRQFRRNGAFKHDILIYVANWPAKRVGHWETLLKARAIENQSYVVGVNRVGTDGNGVEYSGSSMIVDPLGETLAYNSGEETVLTATLDHIHLEDWRKKFPAWQDSDNFDLYL